MAIMLFVTIGIGLAVGVLHVKYFLSLHRANEEHHLLFLHSQPYLRVDYTLHKKQKHTGNDEK